MKNSFQYKVIGKMFVYFSVISILCCSVVFAGITGKIAGKVIDASTKEPLPSVNIVLVGYSLGAATDVDGNYYIINVPPGTYKVTASMVGYEKMTQQDVIVSVDHTTPLNFALKSSAVEGEEVVITAEREVVKKDVSQAEIVSTIEQVQVIPMVTDVMSFVNMQAGVVGDEIREGGLDQIGFMINGLVSVDNRSNRPLMQVNLSTMSEISIIKGGFNAEYGNIRSGLINVITKNPDPKKYNISVEGRFSPARLKHDGYPITSPKNYYNVPFLDPRCAFVGMANCGDSMLIAQYEGWSKLGWKGWNNIAATKLFQGKQLTPQQWQNIYIYQHALEGSAALGQKEIKYGDKPDLYFDGVITGGVPVIGESLGNLAFLLSYKTNYDAFALPTFRDYYVSDNFQFKLVSEVTPTIKVGIEGSYGEINTIARDAQGVAADRYVTSGQDILTTQLYRTAENLNFRGAWWSHAYNPFNIYSSMLGLSVDHMINKDTYYNLRVSLIHVKNSCGPWGPDAYRDTTAKNIDTTLLGNVKLDEAPWGFWKEGNYLTEADNAFFSTFGAGIRDHSYVTTLNAKFDLSSQLDKYNLIKTGFELVIDKVHQDYAGEYYDNVAMNDNRKWDVTPIRFGAYVQDKLEFEGLIANIGIRLDYNDPNKDWFSRAYPFSKYYSWKGKSELFTSMPMEKAKGHLKISPRLGVSHPISEQVKLFFNYGHFYSMPSTSSMYRLDLGRPTEKVANVGNPFALIPKTIAYELGVDYDIAGSVLLRINGFYKNITDQLSSLGFTNRSGNVEYSTYQNNNYEDVRGFEIQLEKRVGWITGIANYTYTAQTSGKVGKNRIYENIVEDLKLGYEDPNLDVTSTRPAARASVTIRTPREWGPEVFGIQPFADLMISPYYTWRAGEYITINYENVLGDVGVKNNVQWKNQWSVDLKISKRIYVSNVTIDIFADINNVLNNRYLRRTNGEVSPVNADNEYNQYYKSLHLPLYNDHRFDGLRASAEAQKFGYFIPGNDKPGDMRSKDKPYIHDMSRDFLRVHDLRYVTFGILVNL